MACVASLIARKGTKWVSVLVGAANEVQAEYKFGDFTGFDRVQYLDTSGRNKRKKGGGGGSSPKKKTLEKGK
jgi:hypothetical protein